MPHLVNDCIDERQVFIFKASFHGNAYVDHVALSLFPAVCVLQEELLSRYYHVL